MVWVELGKLFGKGVAVWILNQALEAAKEWYDDDKITTRIHTLFVQQVIGKNDKIASGRRQFKAADLHFTITELRLNGLAKRPIYLIEIINTHLDGTDPKRIRYFTYETTRRDFWLEVPVQTLLIRAPRGWRALCPNHLDRQDQHPNPDPNWFIQPRTGEETLKPRYFFPGYLQYKKISEHNQTNRAMEKLYLLFIRHYIGVTPEGSLNDHIQVPPRQYHQTAGGLNFWLTPVNSADSDTGSAVLYLLVVQNPQLPEGHPIRVMAFMYNSATTTLLWM